MFIQGRAGIAEEKIGAGWWISCIQESQPPIPLALAETYPKRDLCIAGILYLKASSWVFYILFT